MSRLPLALLLLLPALAHAQQDAAGARARVALVADSAQLWHLEQLHARARTSIDDLTAGFAALRLWEVTGVHSHAHRARGYFDRAADRDPRSAWAHYGYALSFQADMGRDPSFIVTHISAQRALGLDAVSRARRALERAVALDPALPGALELLTRYAAETTDRAALQQARAGFEHINEFGDAAEADLIGLAIATRELTDFAASIDAARRATGRSDASARAWLELAASLAIARDSAALAGAAYFTAVARADDDLLDRLWRELDIIAQPAEQQAWDNLTSIPAKRVFLRRFWDVRAALSTTTAEERAAEHYARRYIAQHQFRRQGRFGAAPQDALRWEKIEQEFDDRGAIYIRHGEPYHRIDRMDNVVWFYTDDEGQPLSFHFTRFSTTPGWQRDFVLRRNLYCGMDSDIIAHDGRLAPLAFGSCRQLSLLAISRTVRADAEHALAHDSHRPAFTSTVPFHFDWYTFRGEHGETDVTFALGLPLDRITAHEQWHVGLAIADTARGTVARSQLSIDPANRSDASGQLLRTHLTLTVPPAPRAAYRVALRNTQDAAIGMVYGGRIHVRAYAGDTLMMSDVVLAAARSGGTFMRAGQPLALAPTQRFAGGELEVFYEIYNLQPGTAYRTEITLEPLGSGLRQTVQRLFGRDQAVRLQFADVAPTNASTTIAELRAVKVPFPKGDYRLRVTISPAGAQRAITRACNFTIA